MYLPNSINVLIYSSNHEDAPHIGDPLVEHNADRQLRPVVLKMRKVRGKTGWMLRRYGHYFGAPKNDPEGLAHKALQVGEYVYELTREEGLVGQRLQGDLIWPSTVAERVVGWTDMTDEEVQMGALKAHAFVSGRNGGKYHIKHNNCQTFIGRLMQGLAIEATAADGTQFLSDTSTDSIVASKSATPCLSDSNSLTPASTVRSSLEIATVSPIIHGKVDPVETDGKSLIKQPQVIVTTTEISRPKGLMKERSLSLLHGVAMLQQAAGICGA